LGLAAISIPGKAFSRTNKAGNESSPDQLKVNEPRTRRISDAGLSISSSKFAATGLAEKLTGFAQTVRGLSRSSFNHPPGQASPTMTIGSVCSTPTTPGFSPQCSIDFGRGVVNQKTHSRNVSLNKQYDSWDDFILQYRQGQFPSDFAITRPRTETPFPPTPPYAASPLEFHNYLVPPLPLNEERRLRALHSFQILQTGIDPNFERIVHLVATVMGVAACVITLVDDVRVSIKAQHPPGNGEHPRHESLCAHAVLRLPEDPMIVLDTKSDWRFKGLPVVTAEESVRFYAGAPLTTSEGLNIGVLCLVDMEPRISFSEKERRLLTDFAAVVMREMELWNDQVQLCIRNRMMRDVTRWVRGCLDMARPETPTGLASALAHIPIGEQSTLLPGNPLHDKAFPAACTMIQATLNVDAVYLVQASPCQSVIPCTGSSVVWNYLDAAGQCKGSVGIVKGGQVFSGKPTLELLCLASSQKEPNTSTRLYDEKYQHTKRNESSWVCTAEGCRPHRLGDVLLDAKEPAWERDLPVIKEMLGYVRQEVNESSKSHGCLFTTMPDHDAVENDWFGASPSPNIAKDLRCRKLHCHTFQGTVPSLSAATGTPYQSAVIVPVQGPSSSSQGGITTDGEPWAYFVILSASRTKQVSFHEKVYLKNFGSCLVTEVMRRRVEAADKAKGTFIK
ncbi:His Kinase A domain containing protein, partial [Modicella reniformis]